MSELGHLRMCLCSQTVFKLFMGEGLWDGRTVAGYFDACSYRQVGLKDQSQLRVLGPIQIPCTGTVDLPFTFPKGNNFDTDSCRNDNMLKWQYYLDSFAYNTYGVIATDFHHKVMLFPEGYLGKSEHCECMMSM